MSYSREVGLFIALFCVGSAGLQAQTSTTDAPVATATATPADKEPAVETIVFIRHGEKPADDKGQINAQGLNRALALPDVLLNKFGKPDFIFAPATTKRTGKSGVQYSYVRPLMTIEPTAIRAGLPVETKFAFDDISSLQEELSAIAYRRATVFVAWEHHKLFEMVKHFVTSLGGEPLPVQDWGETDFDSIYILRLRTDHGKRTIAFELDHEGLDGLPDTYPGK